MTTVCVHDGVQKQSTQPLLEAVIRALATQLMLQPLAEQLLALLPRLDRNFEEWAQAHPLRNATNTDKDKKSAAPVKPSVFLEHLLAERERQRNQEKERHPENEMRNATYATYLYETGKRFPKPKEKKPVLVYYYVPPHNTYSREKNHEMYVFTPTAFTVLRASQAELGHNVLGTAYPGRGLIKVLDTLHGLEFVEVLRHEINHLTFPMLTEDAIRYMTRNQLPFESRYH